MRLTVPKTYRRGFAALLGYGAEDLRRLQDALAVARPSLSLSGFSDLVAEAAGFDRDELEAVLRGIGSLIGVQDESGLRTQFLIEELREALLATGDVGLEPSRADWSVLASFLGEVLGGEKPLAITAKAALIRDGASDKLEGSITFAPAKRYDLFAERAIADSRWMLDLQEDWDGEGGSRIEEATWNVAVGFFRREAAAYREQHGHGIPLPRISPCHDGSIDIHWRSKAYELLVNVRGGPEQYLAGFYGDDFDRKNIKGELDPTSPTAWRPLISCLIKE